MNVFAGVKSSWLSPTFLLVQASFCLALGFVIAQGAPPLLIVAAAVLVSLLVLFAARPEVGLLVIVVLLSSIINENALPLIPLPIGKIYISDLILLSLFLAVALRLLVNRDFRLARSPLNVPMLIFMVVVLYSAHIAVRAGVDFRSEVRELRAVLYYALFFATINLVREKGRVALLVRGLMFIACFVALAMIAQAILGDSIRLTTGRVETLETVGRSYWGVTRVLPPGQTLIFVMFITAACMAILRRGWLFSVSGISALALLSIAMVLTFNRNYWAAASLSLGVFSLSVSRNQRVRIAAMAVVAFLVIAASFTALASSGGRLGRFADAAAERFDFLYEGKQVLRSKSLEFRMMENRYAIKQIEGHPVFGIGLGSRYRPALHGEIDTINNFPALPRYIHNAYMWITTMMGFAGLVPFLCLSLIFIARGLFYWRRVKDELFKSVLAGFAVSYIGIMAAAVVNPLFMQWFSIIVISLMMGATEAIINIHKSEERVSDE